MTSIEKHTSATPRQCMNLALGTRHKESNLLFKTVSITALMLAGAFSSPNVLAQEDETSFFMLEEIVVTARKKVQGEDVQDVPIAVTAFGSDQLESRVFRDIGDLSYSTPNVNLDGSGTTKGIANFSVRGVGINGSVPTIDPAVGTFIDGVYLGINYGVILDTFDIASVEILRGPQGLLFGRNVTGGAVVISTRKPGDEFMVRGKIGLETGLQKTAALSVEGPIAEGKLSAKVSGYYKDDNGYFTNLFDDNDNFGAEETYIIRPVISFTPNDDLEFLVRYEKGSTEADGPASQSRAIFDGTNFDVNFNVDGFADIEWDQLIAEVNWDIGFGNGTITNIFGWREVEHNAQTDVDSLPTEGFTGLFFTKQDQISNELRYAGTFGERFDLTAGVYYFSQDIIYRERRELLGGLLASTFGGNQEHQTWGIFAQGDYDLTETLNLTLGIRYTEEEKDIQVARFNPSNPCDLTAADCLFDDPNDPILGFVPSASFSNVTPKIALQWTPRENLQLYASWTKGFRSGGYNVRITDGTGSPGPFNEESVNSYEVGLKGDWLDDKLRTNLALYRNDISDLQRTVRVPDENVGVIQTLTNTADATIQGIELEVQAIITPNLVFDANLGILDGDYDRVIFDLTGDGVVDATDLALDITRLAPLTYGFGLTYATELSNDASLSFRINHNYRDDAVSTDNNAPGAILQEAHMLGASATYRSPDGAWRITAFGKNLLNEVTEDGVTPLPAVVGGGTLAPLRKGRVIGVEFGFEF